MRRLVTLLPLLPLVASCGSQPRYPGAAAEARIAGLLADYSGADRPGACLLARHAGVVVYERCVGLAELETKQEATPETNFRLASLTKQFTATAVLRLVQDGAVTTTTALTDIFPDFPAYGAAITLHHLMTHTSGLIDYEDLMGADTVEQIKDAGVLALMKAQDSTYFPPGSAFRYSNSGFAVLAQVVERESGTPFARYLEATIFGRLRMTGTVAHQDGVDTVAHRAYGYSRQADGSWARTDQSPTSAVLGDGGIYSSLRDLSRWLAVVEGRRRLLDPAIAARAFEEARLTSGAGAGYGYGWFIDDYRGHPRFRHEGSTIGFRNAVQRFPQEDLTVLFLSNRDEVDSTLVSSIVDAFLTAPGGGR
jgi:CubicO group peptidase (beta-lactamase class C family)